MPTVTQIGRTTRLVSLLPVIYFVTTVVRLVGNPSFKRLFHCLAMFTAEAEYFSASIATIWYRELLRALGFPCNGPTSQFEDNIACIEWSNNVIGGRERAKRIDIRKHYAHEAIQLGHVKLVRVATADQLADVLTKGLQPVTHRANISPS